MKWNLYSLCRGWKGRQMKHHDKSALMGSNKYSWENMKGGGCVRRRWSSWRNNLQLIPDVSGLNTQLDPCATRNATKLVVFCAKTRIPSSRNPIKMHCFATSSLELLEAPKLHVTSTSVHAQSAQVHFPWKIPFAWRALLILNKSFFPKLSLHLRAVFERSATVAANNLLNGSKARLINRRFFEKPLRVPDNGALMEICWSSWTKRKDKKTWICDERFLCWVKNYHRQFIMSPGFGGAKGFRSRKSFIFALKSRPSESLSSSFSDSLHLPREKQKRKKDWN